MRVSCGPAVLAAIAVPALVGASATGGISLVGEFDPAEGAGMNSIGYSAISGEIFVHFLSNPSIHVYRPDGTFVRSIPKPYAGGNDDDMEVPSEPVDVGGTVVPAGTLLIFEGEVSPPRVFAVDPSDGTVLAEQVFGVTGMGQWTGGAFHSTTGTCFVTGWNTNEIHEIDTETGTLIHTFPVRPPGSPDWTLYYSDLDVLDADGQLYLVSSNQNVVRALSPTGEWGAISRSTCSASSGCRASRSTTRQARPGSPAPGGPSTTSTASRPPAA